MDGLITPSFPVVGIILKGGSFLSSSFVEPATVHRMRAMSVLIFVYGNVL